MFLDIALPVVGYLAGSLASAVIVCKLMGLPDPRTDGSGNPGATNVLRLGGKKAAILTLLGDILKGVLPVVAAHALDVSEPARALTALGAFLGHLYPVFFGFKGGKGAATAFGATAALAWPVGIVFALLWVGLAAITRYSSIASLTAALTAPVVSVMLQPQLSYALALAAIAAFVVVRHKENIGRLRAGTEGRIGEKKTG
jgi:glycerol-3-phosphate acyltransferase PlsY